MDVPLHVGQHAARRHQLVSQSRQQLVKRLHAAGLQGVQLPGLRHPAPRPGLGGEGVPLE